MKRAISLLGVAAALLSARTARAQDTPRLGLTMGFPTAVGVIWNLADRLALRPEMTISGTRGESSGSDVLGPNSGPSTDGFQVGAGLSALFYLGRWDALRTYASPRFSYSHTSSSATSGSTILASSSESTGSSYSTSGSFGAEYSIGRRFGVFGEIGFVYTASTTKSTTTLVTTLTSGGFLGAPVTTTTSTTLVRSEAHTKTWGTRSGVGVTFYF
jgi:hypothetical protein